MTDYPTAATHLSPDEVLWRRVPPYLMIWNDDDPAAVRPQGNAFKGREGEDGVSVDRASVHKAAGRGPSALLTVPGCDEHWGVFETTVQVCVDCGFSVIKDACEGNEAHALIKPLPTSGGSKKLTKAAHWAVTPLPAS